MKIRRKNVAGFIQGDRLYLVSEAKRRLGMGDWAWRRLVRGGLSQIKQGRRAYVLGSDLIEHLKEARS